MLDVVLGRNRKRIFVVFGPRQAATSYKYLKYVVVGAVPRMIYGALLSPLSSGPAAEGLRQGVRLVVPGRDHVRVPGGVHALLRGGPRDHVPEDSQLAAFSRDTGGDGDQRVGAVHAVSYELLVCLFLTPLRGFFVYL